MYHERGVPTRGIHVLAQWSISERNIALKLLVLRLFALLMQVQQLYSRRFLLLWGGATWPLDLVSCNRHAVLVRATPSQLHDT